MDFGKWGEEVAEKYLIQKGYQILEKNFRFQKFEIDLICTKDSKLIAIEVKTRSSTHVISPIQAVNPKKQKNIIKAINHFVEVNQFIGEIRLDVITILKENNDIQIEHIEEAFFPFV